MTAQPFTRIGNFLGEITVVEDTQVVKEASIVSCLSLHYCLQIILNFFISFAPDV